MGRYVERWVTLLLAAVIGSGAAVAGEGGAFLDFVRERAGSTRGICVVEGATDAALVEALVRETEFYVHARFASPPEGAALRRALATGERRAAQVIVEAATDDRLPYSEDYIDLLIAPGLTAETATTARLQEIRRVMRPGSLAVLGNADAEALTATALTAALAATGMTVGSEIVEQGAGRWALYRKPVPATDDDWSHWYHGPDNNPVGTDQTLKPPYEYHWLDLPYQSAQEVLTVVAGGRVFSATGSGVRWPEYAHTRNKLTARNGYNGIVLWEHQLPYGYKVHRSGFIATADVLYRIDGNACLLLAAATGETVARVELAAEGRELKWLALQDGVLYAMDGPADTTVLEKVQYAESIDFRSKPGGLPWVAGDRVTAYDLERRELAWAYQSGDPLDGRVIGLTPDKLVLYSPGVSLTALALADGRVAWRQADATVMGELAKARTRGLDWVTTCGLLCTPDYVFVDHHQENTVAAFSAADGAHLWSHPKTAARGNARLLMAGDRLIAGRVGKGIGFYFVDPKSGEIHPYQVTAEHSCARLTATGGILFGRVSARSIPESLDGRQNERLMYSFPERTNCLDGVLPANGLLYLTPTLCQCGTNPKGFIAFRSAPAARPLMAAAKRLERGPAAPPAAPVAATAADWPGPGHDASRAGASPVAIPAELTRLWTYAPPSPATPTAPVAVGDAVYIADDAGRVQSLDAGSGALRWQWLTGGPILFSPTVWRGRVYVGSNDGYVYCLDAATGGLIWRFRAARDERRIMLYGHLSAASPVNSGVLIEDGVAYFVAGLQAAEGSSVYAIDALTGAIRWVNHEAGVDLSRSQPGVSSRGLLLRRGDQLIISGGAGLGVFALADGAPAIYPDGAKPGHSGMEPALLDGRYIVYGGPSLRSGRARDQAIKLTTSASLRPVSLSGESIIAPAWDDEIAVYVTNADIGLVCWRTPDLLSLLDGIAAGRVDAYRGNAWMRRNFTPPNLAWGPVNRVFLDVVVTPSAVVALCANADYTWKFERATAGWQLVHIDRATGAIRAAEDLPAEPLREGLCVTRDGRTIIAYPDGSLTCHGAK